MSLCCASISRLVGLSCLVGTLIQEKALVGAFSVTIKLRLIFDNLRFKLYCPVSSFSVVMVACDCPPTISSPLLLSNWGDQVLSRYWSRFHKWDDHIQEQNIKKFSLCHSIIWSDISYPQVVVKGLRIKLEKHPLNTFDPWSCTDASWEIYGQIFLVFYWNLFLSFPTFGSEVSNLIFKEIFWLWLIFDICW